MRLRHVPSDILTLLLLFFSTEITETSAYEWPGDPRLDALERLIYEDARPNGDSLFSLLGNCDFRDRGSIQSTTVAATWLRMAYHDSATFNITDQTGGLDGSIHFELDRAENIGGGLTATQQEYSGHSSKYVSNADVIAIGAAGAVANCGGPIIPMRGGRVDATKAGRFGVPEPEKDIQTHTEQFRLQGFNATEMIELIACGHTLGGVESKDFPNIVDFHPSDVPVQDLGFDSVSAPFDNTTAFDTAVVTQYLDGTTMNPLVVGRNVTTRSDLRIFNSDGNVTMKALADPSTFQKRCGIVFEKMIDTVPAGVQLTEPIDLISEKPHFHTGLRIGKDGVTFVTSLRRVRLLKEPVLDGSRVSLFWCDRYGDDAECKSGFSNKIGGSSRPFNLTGSPFMVRFEKEFRIYPFHTPIDPTRSISRFWWEVEQGDGAERVRIDNNGAKYPVLQDQLVYATPFSGAAGFKLGPNDELHQIYSMAVGVRDDINPSRVYLDLFDNGFGGRKPGSITNVTVDLALNSSLRSASGYNLYSALFDAEVGGAATFDFHVEADGKKWSLDFKALPKSAAQLPEDPFIVNVGKVERVAYNATPGGAIPPPPSSAVVLATSPGMTLLFGLALTLGAVLNM